MFRHFIFLLVVGIAQVISACETTVLQANEFSRVRVYKLRNNVSLDTDLYHAQARGEVESAFFVNIGKYTSPRSLRAYVKARMDDVDDLSIGFIPGAAFDQPISYAAIHNEEYYMVSMKSKRNFPKKDANASCPKQKHIVTGF